MHQREDLKEKKTANKNHPQKIFNPDIVGIFFATDFDVVKSAVTRNRIDHFFLTTILRIDTHSIRENSCNSWQVFLAQDPK